MAKAPAPRGMTVNERRSTVVEKRSLPLTLIVAVLAASISFVSLHWVGVQQGMHPLYIAPLLPLVIDGLGIICSLGIVRSAAAGESFRDRASEWVGLSLSLALSMLGNAAHALEANPSWLKVTYAVAVPGIVAYALHVLGKYMGSGVSNYVLADSDGEVRFDITQLGESTTPAPARARTSSPSRSARPAGARAPAPASSVDRAPVTEETGARPRTAEASDGFKARARALFDLAVSVDPSTKPDAGSIHVQIESTKDKATTRRWVQTWWETFVAEQDSNPELLVDADARRERIGA